MTSLQEPTPLQTATLERLVARGFHLVAYPLYASAIGVRRDGCAALLVPVDGDGFRLLGQPCYLIEGNLSVRVQRPGGPHFVWKDKSVPATSGLLAQLTQFAEELQAALSAKQ
jgi:hypothetical protein